MPGSSPPNILLIIVHDLGTHLGCYGQTSVHSPALDQLAGEGVLFENHYCTAAYCSPSRGAIFTGMHPHVNGLMGLVNLGWDLPPSNVTLAQLLGRSGYETFLFGFQHEVKDAERLPTYFDHVSDRSVSYRCEHVAPLVIDFLEQRGRAEGRPFYARVGFSEVHRYYDRYEPEDPEGVVVPPYLIETPGARQDFAEFHGCIRWMDQHVGQILAALGRSGLADDTIVVFTTDHGIDYPTAKGSLYDPGIHTTLLMRWPDRLESGRRITELISNVDVLPSLLDAAGCTAPSTVLGHSFWTLLVGGEYEPKQQVYAEMNSQLGDAKRCIRTDRYKYIRNFDQGPAVCMGICSEISLTRRDMGDTHLAPRSPVELYDLQADPLEFDNLAGRPETAEVERGLADRLNRFLEETDDPVLRGPVPRPPEEEDHFRRIWGTLPGDTKHPMRDIEAYLAALDSLRWDASAGVDDSDARVSLVNPPHSLT